MNDKIKALVEKRGITRICHITPSRNILSIAKGEEGILSTTRLRVDERKVFNPNDLARYDGHPDKICCTIQYPNAWYLSNKQALDAVWGDWVILMINPCYLWQMGTLFCPLNAASGHGQHIAEGLEGFKALYAPTVTDRKGRTFARGPNHLASLPTNEQAEVLVPNQIQPVDILAIGVKDEAQAVRERQRLHMIGYSCPEIVVVSDFFKPYQLSRQVREGNMPGEWRLHPKDKTV